MPPLYHFPSNAPYSKGVGPLSEGFHSTMEARGDISTILRVLQNPRVRQQALKIVQQTPEERRNTARLHELGKNQIIKPRFAKERKTRSSTSLKMHKSTTTTAKREASVVEDEQAPAGDLGGFDLGGFDLGAFDFGEPLDGTPALPYSSDMQEVSYDIPIPWNLARHDRAPTVAANPTWPSNDSAFILPTPPPALVPLPLLRPAVSEFDTPRPASTKTKAAPAVAAQPPSAPTCLGPVLPPLPSPAPTLAHALAPSPTDPRPRDAAASSAPAQPVVVAPASSMAHEPVPAPAPACAAATGAPATGSGSKLPKPSKKKKKKKQGKKKADPPSRGVGPMAAAAAAGLPPPLIPAKPYQPRIGLGEPGVDYGALLSRYTSSSQQSAGLSSSSSSSAHVLPQQAPLFAPESQSASRSPAPVPLGAPVVPGDVKLASPFDSVERAPFATGTHSPARLDPPQLAPPDLNPYRFKFDPSLLDPAALLACVRPLAPAPAPPPLVPANARPQARAPRQLDPSQYIDLTQFASDDSDTSSQHPSPPKRSTQQQQQQRAPLLPLQEQDPDAAEERGESVKRWAREQSLHPSLDEQDEGPVVELGAERERTASEAGDAPVVERDLGGFDGGAWQHDDEGTSSGEDVKPALSAHGGDEEEEVDQLADDEEEEEEEEDDHNEERTRFWDDTAADRAAARARKRRFAEMDAAIAEARAPVREEQDEEAEAAKAERRRVRKTIGMGRGVGRLLAHFERQTEREARRNGTRLAPRSARRVSGAPFSPAGAGSPALAAAPRVPPTPSTSHSPAQTQGGARTANHAARPTSGPSAAFRKELAAVVARRRQA